MTTNIPLPERGYRQKIADIVGCTTKTVTLALRHKIKGYKSDQVRKTYQRLYIEPYLKKEKELSIIK